MYKNKFVDIIYKMIYIIIIFVILIIICVYMNYPNFEHMDDYQYSNAIDAQNDMRQVSVLGRFNDKYLVGETKAYLGDCRDTCIYSNICTGVSHNDKTNDCKLYKNTFLKG